MINTHPFVITSGYGIDKMALEVTYEIEKLGVTLENVYAKIARA